MTIKSKREPNFALMILRLLVAANVCTGSRLSNRRKCVRDDDGEVAAGGCGLDARAGENLI